MGHALKRKRSSFLQKRRKNAKNPAVEDKEQEFHSPQIYEESDQTSEEEVVDPLEGLDAPTQTTSQRESTNPAKPPTGVELRQIQEASDLFKSNSFKLQIDALLPRVRPKKSHIASLDRFLMALHTILNSLPAKPPQHPLDASRALLKNGIAVPYPNPVPSEDTNWTVAFEKPTDITVAGSWANQVSVKAKDGAGWGVDVAVEMPAELFQQKDYLNARVFHKRAFYVAALAEAITKSKVGLNVDATYDSMTWDTRLTCLVLRHRVDGTPTDFTKLNAFVRLVPVLPTASPIALHHLSPSHANLRMKPAGSSNPAGQPQSTPVYNNALLQCASPRLYLIHTHALLQEVPAFRDALALLRVWANQRGYGISSGTAVRGVFGFESCGPWWAALLGMLIVGEDASGGAKPKRKPVGKRLSSYQLFRAALDFLSRHDFEKEPIFVKSKDGHRFPQDEHKMHHEATFMDASSSVNMLAGVPLASLDLLREDAKITLQVLNNSLSTIDPFTEVFLKDHRDLVSRFDMILSVDMSSSRPRDLSRHDILDRGSPTAALIHSLCSTVRQGLGNRAKAIAVLVPPSSPRALTQAHPAPTIGHVQIGLLLDPVHAQRLVDHGPAADAAESPEAVHFRTFWGDKAEMRRFKDGRITESVVWDIKRADEKAHIPALIVRHLLALHFGLDPDNDVRGWQAEFDSVLRLPEDIATMVPKEAGFKAALGAFDAFVRHIKSLDETLPLSLLNASPISPTLRYTSVFAPIPLPASLRLPACARHHPAMDVVLQFERSARWPDDLAAIQKMKLAFFERVAAGLLEHVPGLTANVVVGNGEADASDIMDQARLEVVTPQGWAFSARIWHDREATLLARLTGATTSIIKGPAVKNAVDSGERYQAKEALALYTRRFLHAPRHHRAVAALSHRFGAYAGTVRLVKRWLAAHWILRGHVTDEAVELLCAGVFVGDGKVLATSENERRTEGPGVPGSKERGFAKVVAFLKEWAWEAGTFVPIYGAQSDRHETAENEKQATVQVGVTAGAWIISTEEDTEGRMWTSYGPKPLSARRVKDLAQATWAALQRLEGGLNAKSLFLHPTDDYDFLIHLDPAMLNRYCQNVNADASVWAQKYANLMANEQADEVHRVGFDPAWLFFRDLQRIYANTVELFYDTFGGTIIGAVWEPSLSEPRPFRILSGYSPTPCLLNEGKGKNKDLVILNKAAVLAEIHRLGEGLVKTIQVQNMK